MRLKALVIATTLMAYAAPVMAQGVEVHDHSKKKGGKGTVQVGTVSEAKVTGWAPMSGPVGTLVTITGQNFLQQTRVKVGGRPVKIESFSPTTITFQIPGRYYDGVISIHHPGMGNEIPVGTFQVQVDPRIANFNPRSGPVGTRVELNGEGFVNGDQILFNGRPLQIAEFGANRIVVVIPQGATSDDFTVYRPSTKYSWDTKQRFEVSMPAPTVSGLAPTQGAPGTQVRITGSYFGPDDRVYYGDRQPVAIVARADSWIDVQVPPNARQSNPFTIRGGRGTVQTPVFVLVVNPSIARFQPDHGGPGTRVDIYGSNFAQGDQVYLNGKPLKRIDYNDQKLVVEIPAGASTDRFVVWRNGQAIATANRPFEVMNAPTISGFSPTQGPSGTKVQISGDGFDRDVRVTYGAQQLQVVGRRGDREIDVIVPRGAQSQPFTVTTRGGSVSTASAFQVVDYSSITGISPDRGPTGTKVTISQQGYSGNDNFWLGNVALPVVERSPGRYVVQIPANAQTGRVEWESYGRRQPSNYVFTVTQPAPTFSPTSGPPGTRVTVSGYGLTPNTRIRFRNQWVDVTARTANSLEFFMPRGEPGVDSIYVVDGNDRVALTPAFQLQASPIPTFAPVSGPAGTKVTITGQGFSANTRIRLGNKYQTITGRTANTIEFVVESDTGTDTIYLMDGKESIKLSPGYSTTAPPPSTFAPQSGPVGTRVVITGYRFSPNVRVRIGNKFQNITAKTANTIEFMAEGNPGIDTVYIVDGKDVEKLSSFTIIGAPKPSPPPPAPPPPPPPQPAPGGSCAFTAAPDQAQAGGTVTIDTNYCNVKNVKQGWFKGQAVQIVSVSPTAVVVRLPGKAAGTDNIALETDDGRGVAVRVRTSNKITVKAGY